jgi:hypothetical protein
MKMRRWSGGFVAARVAVVGAAAFTALMGGCDLGLTPFVEPTDAQVTPAPTIEGGSDATRPGEDARAPLDGSVTETGGDAGGDAGVVKRVFVTSTLTNGAFGGQGGADVKCQQAVASGALGGNFIAWVSVAAAAAPARLLDVGPWYLVGTKTRVFANKAAITGLGPEVPIDRDEKGTVVGNPESVWTGTLSNGTAAPQSCTNFTLAGAGQLGQAGSVQKLGQWTQAGNDTCNTMSRIYCIEQ